jgi:cellulose synthase/poly-beta-1,6-N-acetylglucosamine synthase-like glycosyltransferase
MTLLGFFVLAVYTLSLAYITLYCVIQFNLLYHYKKGQNQSSNLPQAKAARAAQVPVAAGGDAFAAEEEEDWPFVTIQLPIFNELYVIERLMEAVANFDYPRDRFEIHVLDDSTDETVEVVAAKVAELQARGLDVQQIRREVRQGFKAGALRDGMSVARGEFIAIFDADFLPRPDFLRQTIPHFEKDNIGVVQTRWEHINQDYSLITQLQALQLNVHFTVEQAGRMRGDYLLQFNGTAGVWRRQTIEDAGGWEADTLTEDLDLSIRAQLKGWRILFLEGIGSPAELPAEMNSFKSQQYRWMKGGAETAKKMLPTVWRSALSLRQKLQATSHLLSSSIFVFVFLTGVFSVPLLFFLGDFIAMGFSKNFFAYFLIGLLSIIAIYYVANVQSPANQEESFSKSVFKFLVLFPLFLALSMGLSLHNSIAVIQGWIGKQTPFVRTPKFNIKNMRDSFQQSNYLTEKLKPSTIGEGILALYFAGAVGAGFYLQNTTFIAFHILLALGYGAIFIFTLRHLSLR